MEGIELLVFIVARGRGDELLKRCAKENISFSLLMHGRSAADKELLNLIGYDGAERDVVVLSVERARADAMLYESAEALELDKQGEGIAFMIPFSAAAGQFMSYEMFAGKLPVDDRKRPLDKLVDRIFAGSKGTEVR